MKFTRGKFFSEHRRNSGTITMAISKENNDIDAWLEETKADSCTEHVTVFFEQYKDDAECLKLYRQIQETYKDAIIYAVFDVPPSEMQSIIKSTKEINDYR